MKLLSEILRSGQSESDWSPQSEIEWDDAYDSLDHFDSVHQAAIPYLCSVIRDVGIGTAYDRYARSWAIKAAEKVGAVGDEFKASLSCALKSSDSSLRKQADLALRRLKRREGRYYN